MSFDRATIDNWSPEDIARFKRIPPRSAAGGVAILAATPAHKRLVAEGDSWFDYFPGTDIIDCLRRFHGFEIDNHSHAGDTLENMVFGSAVPAVMDAIGVRQPKAFLVSGGGNDVAGDEFESYLNHVGAGLPLTRPDVITYMVETAFRSYLQKLIAAVAASSPNTTIVMHGYGHTKPTGKGVINLFGLLHFVGPWLLPALQRKGILNPADQDTCVQTLIDRYNDMLADLAAHNPRFHYVDLRGLINKDRDWANELHLTNSAFAKVSDKLADVINALP